MSCSSETEHLHCNMKEKYYSWHHNILSNGCCIETCACDSGKKQKCMDCGIICCNVCYREEICDGCKHHRAPEEGCYYCNPIISFPDDIKLCASYVTNHIIIQDGDVSWCSSCQELVDNTVHNRLVHVMKYPTIGQAIEKRGYMGKCQYCDEYFLVDVWCENCNKYCCIRCSHNCSENMQDIECLDCEQIMRK